MVWWGLGWGCCYLVIKSGLLVYTVTYLCLITDFDHELLGREVWWRSGASQSQKYLESCAFRTASWTLAMQASLRCQSLRRGGVPFCFSKRQSR